MRTWNFLEQIVKFFSNQSIQLRGVYLWIWYRIKSSCCPNLSNLILFEILWRSKGFFCIIQTYYAYAMSEKLNSKSSFVWHKYLWEFFIRFFSQIRVKNVQKVFLFGEIQRMETFFSLLQVSVVPALARSAGRKCAWLESELFPLE